MVDSNKYRSINESGNDFYVAGIGASAGGFEAMEAFFRNLPLKTNIAFIVIQHLDPNKPGMMPDLIRQMAHISVIDVVNGITVEPDNIYVIPPGKTMVMTHGRLFLFDIANNNDLKRPIDIFFESLAKDRKEKSLGIILSGMGSDGSRGVKEIKSMNGLVITQDTSDAKYPSMPQNANKSVKVDLCCAATDLPVEILKLIKYILNIKNKSDKKSKSMSSLSNIIILIREKTGHDFSQYKNSTIYRRIERRKNVHQIKELKQYLQFLRANPEEIEILFKELLIGVTNFFRDTEVWDKLKNNVIPDLIEKAQDGSTLRAWVPACSTGEEVYSLAIVFQEVIEKIRGKKNVSMQIFATDLDVDAIEFARKGVYSNNIKEDVSRERLNKYFIEGDNNFRLSTSIREMIVFAPQNVLKDPPFTKLDILTCRNMLIYMEGELQDKIISLFNYSLNPNGILVLGTSESLGNSNARFTELYSKLKIYQNSASKSSLDPIHFPSSFYRTIDKVNKDTPERSDQNINMEVNNIILQEYSPASVLINEKGDIIYITGRTGSFLEPPMGKANWNIIAMARDGVKQVLPALIRKAMQNFDQQFINSVKFKIDGVIKTVDIKVKRLDKPKLVKGMLLIVFSNFSSVLERKQINTSDGYKRSSREQELEEELKQVSEELQSINEEMQTSQEELKSTNEELQSTNEELQSTNEELTTSKEEMQSLNEELQTVNMELQSKVNDFMRSNDDMVNLLNSTNIATLYLDKGLNIRRFTDQATTIFKLRNSDVGRPFTEIVTNLKYSKLEKDALDVLKSLVFIETSVETIDNKWFDVKIMPYRTIDDHIDGLVITFSDISVAKKLELELIEANEKLKNRIDHKKPK